MNEETDLIWATLESLKNDKNRTTINYLQSELLRITNVVKLEYDKMMKDIYDEIHL